MMKTKNLFSLLVCLVMVSAESFAQQATISGYLTDAASGEALMGATVREAVSRKVRP